MRETTSTVRATGGISRDVIAYPGTQPPVAERNQSFEPDKI